MNDSATLTEIGRRLREAANDAGMTLRELGDKMGVSRPTIYAYASGALKMNERRIQQAAQITGRPAGFFEPRNVEDLDPRSSMIQSFKLIDALLAPPSPAKATDAAREALESNKEAETPAIRAELLRRLGNSLTQTGDYVGAIRQLEAALVIFDSEGARDKQALCLQTLGVCYISLGQVEQARKCFEEALVNHDDQTKWKAEIALAALAERVGDFEEAEAQLSRLLDNPTLDDVALTYVRANYASIVCARGRWKSGYSQTETALESAFATSLNDQIAELLVQSALALTWLGRLEEATLMVVRARDVAFTVKDEARATLADVAKASLIYAFRKHDEAREVIGNTYARAMQGQYRRSESLALLLKAELAFERGDDMAAFEFATQAVSHATAHQMVVATAQGYAAMAKSLSRLGRQADASAALQKSSDLVDKIGEGRAKVLLAEAQGWLQWSSGDQKIALSTMESAADYADSQELLVDAIRIVEGLVNMSESLSDVSYSQACSARLSSLHSRAEELCPNPDVWLRFLRRGAQSPAGSLGGDR